MLYHTCYHSWLNIGTAKGKKARISMKIDGDHCKKEGRKNRYFVPFYLYKIEAFNYDNL